MRKTILLLSLTVSALLLGACQGSPTTPAANNNAAAPKPTANPGQTAPQLAEGHKSGGATKPAAPPSGNSAAPSDEEKSKVPAALQEKVTKAEAKAKAPNASAADKKAAAAAFMERGNIFYLAGDPKLYKYALRDFRIAARLDPTNQDAVGKRDQIIGIYQQLGRPAPSLGEEP